MHLRSFTPLLSLGAALAALALLPGANCAKVPDVPREDAGLDADAGPQDAGAQDAGGGADAGLPAQGACAVLNARRCELLQRCGLVDPDPAALRSCQAYFAATWCGPSRWPALVEASTLRYDAFAALACAEAFGSSRCEAFEAEPSACSRFLSPNRHLGQPCYGSYQECREGVCRGFSCPKACSPAGAANEACDSTDDCRADAGLYCQLPPTGAVGKCVALGAVGSACDVDRRCAPDLFCNDQTPSTCESRRSLLQQCLSTADCVAEAWCHFTAADGGFCLSRGGADAGCTDDDQCGSGLLCQTLTGRCEPSGPLPLGTPCSLRQDCVDAGVCAGAAPGQLGRCQVPALAGEACGTSFDCQRHLACAATDGGRRCGPRLPTGYPCSVSRDCWAFSRCVGGACVDLPAPGAPCLAQACLYGSCQTQPDGGNLCVNLGAPGASCGGDEQCASGRCASGRCTSACAP